MKISFPSFGIYNEVLKELFEELGYEVVIPRIKVKNSPPMICFPYKVTLGTFIDALERGATKLVVFNTAGKCRFKHYFDVQGQVLRDMGYNFEIVELKLNILSFFKKLNPDISYFKAVKLIKKYYKKIIEVEEKNYKFEKKGINIGIIGEVYTILEHRINYNVIEKLKRLNAGVHISIKLSDFVKHYLRLTGKSKEEKESYNYLKQKIGGHGRESISNTLYYVKNNFDAIIHILPLTCLKGDTNITIEDYKIKSIKDVKVGDKVLTHKGRFKRVTKKFVRGYKNKLLEINCGGMSKLEITPEHPILALRSKKIICREWRTDILCRPKYFYSKYCKIGKAYCKKKFYRNINFNPEFIQVDKLKKGDLIAVPIPKISKNRGYLDVKEKVKLNWREHKYKNIKKFYYTQDIMRFLGYWLAEGSTIKHNNKKYKGGLIFTFNIKEKDYVNEIKEIINKNFDANIKLYKNPEKNRVDLWITNTSLAYIMHYLCNEYSWGKVLSKELMDLPICLQLEIVRGFFRGDGGIENTKTSCRYNGSTVSRQLASQLFWMLIRNRIRSSISTKHQENRRRSYQIKINTYNDIKKLESKIKLIKKESNQRYMEIEDYFLIPIREIKEKDFEGKVYNLEVEDDNSYVANFLAVHNCAPETIVEPLIDKICKENNNFPLLRFPIDNDFFETGMDMRLKSLISRIKRKRIKEKHPEIKEEGYFLALDSGSIALKGVLMDTNKSIIKLSYIKHTNLINALKEVLTELKTEEKILSSCVTGTGKKFIAKIIGADILEEETECQYASAVHLFPNCNTVLDIGGQDSKLILEDSCDFNESCASGTGYIIESIANEVGVKVEDAGKVALQHKNLFPFSGTCGVFARRSVIERKNMGVPKEEILWGIHCALVDSYWTKLVKDRELKPDFVFQGATAQNKALVKCFEEKLKSKLNVPQHPHLSGAYGGALIAMQNYEGKKTKFRGFDKIINSKIKTEPYIAKGCGKMCEIIKIYQDNEISYLGNGCEKCIAGDAGNGSL